MFSVWIGRSEQRMFRDVSVQDTRCVSRSVSAIYSSPASRGVTDTEDQISTAPSFVRAGEIKPTDH